MITFVDKIEEANCITHSGTMHADEVFATAFLELLLGDIKLFRTSTINDKNIKDNALIYDIGRGKFDHHQKDAEKRPNNIPYCAFGLLFKEFGKSYLQKINIEYIDEVKADIETDLIEGIDADDNGIFPHIESLAKVKTLSNIIKIFNPSYNSNEEENSQFLKAVDVAKKIFEEEVYYINGKVCAKKKVEQLFKEHDSNKKFLILEEFLPYEETLLSIPSASNILYVAYPSNRGGYAIKTVPKSLEDKLPRKPFPEEWAGLQDEELESVSKIKGLIFCHTNRFLVSCKEESTVYEVLDYLCN